MCGISVLLDRACRPDGLERLRRMHAVIPHRGPDGEGFLLVEDDRLPERLHRAEALPGERRTRLGLAFRRLKVVDCSDAAAQPLSSPDGRCFVAFNGEIYNFRSLRAELQRQGRTFRSHSDSEVALAAYEAWGEGCFERLDGMWAMAIVDLARRRLVASRDRLGIKPLYWALQDDRLLLASEIKQLLAASPVRPMASQRLVARYLAGTRYPCVEDTFFEGVRSVPPASWFEVPLDGPGGAASPTFRPYWRLADYSCSDPRPAASRYARAREAYRERLVQAVDSHRVSDVPLGCLLSGGLDSSTLASFLIERLRSEGRDCPTFSFGLGALAPELDELPYAKALVAQDRLLNHSVTFDAGWIRSHVPRVIRSLEEPPLGLAALAQYRIFQACREHGTTVVLDGEGADEVLAGYPYQQGLFVRGLLRRGRLPSFTRELAALARRRGASIAGVVAGELLRPALRPLRRRPRPAWLAPALRALSPSAEERDAAADRGPDGSPLNQDLYFSLRWGNMKIILPYTDKNAMAHSVEARVPYLDRALVELAFSLPDHYKAGNGETKRLLRDIARERLPRRITERRGRMGFATPDHAFLAGPLAGDVREALCQGFLDSACFEARAARDFVDSFLAGAHSDFRAIWRLYALERWTRAFDVSLA